MIKKYVEKKNTSILTDKQEPRTCDVGTRKRGKFLPSMMLLVALMLTPITAWASEFQYGGGYDPIWLTQFQYVGENDTIKTFISQQYWVEEVRNYLSDGNTINDYRQKKETISNEIQRRFEENKTLEGTSWIVGSSMVCGLGLGNMVLGLSDPTPPVLTTVGKCAAVGAVIGYGIWVFRKIWVTKQHEATKDEELKNQLTRNIKGKLWSDGYLTKSWNYPSGVKKDGEKMVSDFVSSILKN